MNDSIKNGNNSKEIEIEILLKIHDDEFKEKDISKNCIKFHPKILEQNLLNNEMYLKIKKNSSIATLKILISDIKNNSAEKIHIFFLDFPKEISNYIEKLNNINNFNNNNILLLTKINEDFYNKNKIYLEECRDMDYITSLSKRLDVNNYPNLFYLINDININDNNYPICIIIDFYQQNIDKIIFNLESNCSIFLLKNMIFNKLNSNENINISQIKLFCIDVNQINEMKNITINIKNVDKSFSDLNNLDDIIEYFYPIDLNERNNFKYNIHFVLTIVNEFKMYEHIGLNFRFNYLKEVHKISFDENAPNYCECSDGINLFIFCFNKECYLYNKYFVINIGYGVFNILKQINNIKCPKCNNSNNLQLKNIGIINSKYYYKGIMKSNKEKKSKIEGDNITLDDKLYIFKEAKINSFLSELYMEAKPYFIIPNKSISKRTKEEEELDDIYLSDNIKSHKITPLSIDNSNKIKIYDNESDLIDKNDIIIDGLDSKILDKDYFCIEDANIFYPFCFYEEGKNKSNNLDDNCTDKSSVCCIF